MLTIVRDRTGGLVVDRVGPSTEAAVGLVLGPRLLVPPAQDFADGFAGKT